MDPFSPTYLKLVVALGEEGVDEDGQALLLLEGGQDVLQQLQLTVAEVLPTFNSNMISC